MDSSEEKHGDSLDNLPPGYRFEPNPQELIQHYLTPKINGIPLTVNPIHEINNIYHHSPEDVTGRFNAQGEKGKNKVWYFMTSRDKKYINGRRPNRKAGNGYWKATGKEKEVRDDNNQVIGHQRSLVYHIGVPQENMHLKTQWQMLELRVPDPPNSKPVLLNNKRKRSDDQQQHTMRLEGYVICRIYYKEKEKEVAEREVAAVAEEAATVVVTETEEANTTTTSTTTHTNQMMKMTSQVINNTCVTTTYANNAAHITYNNTNINRSSDVYIPETINSSNTNINRSSDVYSPETINSNSNYLAAFGGPEYNHSIISNEDDIVNMINELDDHHVNMDQTLMPPPLPLDISRPDYLSDIPSGPDPGFFSEPPAPDFFSDLVFPLSTHM